MFTGVFTTRGQCRYAPGTPDAASRVHLRHPPSRAYVRPTLVLQRKISSEKYDQYNSIPNLHTLRVPTLRVRRGPRRFTVTLVSSPKLCWSSRIGTSLYDPKMDQGSMSIRTLRSIQIHPWIKVDHKFFRLLPKTHAYIKTRIDDPRRLRRAVASPGSRLSD